MAEDKKLIFKTAYLYFQEGRWDKAIAEFKRLAALDPEDLTARNMLGDAFMKKGAMKEAYDEYAFAAEGYSKKGEPEKANAIYKKMSKLEVNNLDAAQQKKIRIISLIVRGDQAYEQGNYEEAVLAYQEVANIDAANMEVVAKLADIYARLGRNKEAAANCFAVAKFYLDSRLFKRALIYYQKVVELEPSNVDARLALGDLLSREGQELEARKEFQSVAEYFLSQGQLDKAQQCCQKAIALKSIDAHWILGDIFLKRGQWDEAKIELEAFLKIKANHVPAQYSLGVVLLSKGALDEAIAIFGRILGRQPDHVESLERMAEVYEKKGSPKDAVVQILSLAKVFMGQRILDRAETALRRALTLDRENLEAHKALAELYEMRGMKREAAEEYLTVIKAAKAQNLTAEVAAGEQKVRSIDPGLVGVAGGGVGVRGGAARGGGPSAPPPPPPMPSMPAGGGPAVGAPPPPPKMPSIVPVPAMPKAAAPAPRPAAPPPVAPRPAAAPVAARVPAAPVSAVPPGPRIPAAAPAPPVLRAPAVPPRPAAAMPQAPVPAVRPAVASEMTAMPAVAPPRPKTVLTPDQRAKRMISMAQSAMRQGSFDEALDFLNQAQLLVPDDASIKDSIQAVMAEFMAKSAGKRQAGLPPAARSAPAAAAAPAPAAPVAGPPVRAAEPPPPPAETAEAVEKRIRAQLEREYQARADRAAPVSHEATREQILAKAGPEEPGGPAFPLALGLPAASSEDPLTETMAEVYLSQGHLEEALSVYESVLKREPGRADLRQKVAEMRARLALPEMPSAAPEPPARPSAPAPAAPPRLEPAAVVAAPEPVRARPRVSYV